MAERRYGSLVAFKMRQPTRVCPLLINKNVCSAENKEVAVDHSWENMGLLLI